MIYRRYVFKSDFFFCQGPHHLEYLSLVTMNTNPPQTYYGSGDTTESAQNEVNIHSHHIYSRVHYAVVIRYHSLFL